MPLDLIKLSPLMELNSGRSEILVGLVDGPVAIDHPAILAENVHELPGKLRGACTMANSAACMHGTFVAGILCARRSSTAPAICPSCTLLVRPNFSEAIRANGQIPSASPGELAGAIVDCVKAGARLINLSVALVQPSSSGQRALEEALDYALRHKVILVAAAGNQGTIGSSAITSHPWVIPVVAYDLGGRPMGQSNLGSSIGRRGVGAPGYAIASLGATGKPFTLSGTSVAAPFVTGATALLWSKYLAAAATQVKWAVIQGAKPRRSTIIPPLMDAWSAYQIMSSMQLQGGCERHR